MEKVKANDIATAINVVGINESILTIGDGIDITVKNIISVTDMVGFVNYVVENCFDDETNMFRPEIKDFAVRCSIYEFYTNVDLPGDTEEAYIFVYNSGDIIDKIMTHINKTQFRAIMDAINEKINSIVRANISVASSQINDAYNKINKIAEQFEEAFSGFDKGTIETLISSVSDGKIDESKLVAAYLNQKRGSEE